MGLNLIVLFLGMIFMGPVHAEVITFFDLKVGDIILQPLEGTVAELIQEEEETPFAHAGLVIEKRAEKISIAEAYGAKGVVRVAIDQFLAKGISSPHLLKVIRHSEYKKINPEDLLKRFQKSFEGKPYNSKFEWSERNAFYCTQMITLLLNPYFSEGGKIRTKKMHFNKNRDAWEKLYRDYHLGPLPDGKEGNSPGDFDHDQVNFVTVGLLFFHHY